LKNLGSIDVQRCRLEGNVVGAAGPTLDDTSEIQRHGGGALAAQDFSVMSIAGSVITKNIATGRGADGFREGQGGAITLDGNATLQLGPGVRVYGNIASFTGGGLATGNGRFSPHAVRQAIFNNTARYNPDVSVATERITLVHNISQLNVTSRLGVSRDSPVVEVRLSGAHGFPCGDRVEAILDKYPIARMTPQSNGIAEFRLNIRERPGLYNLSFRTTNVNVVAVQILVNVTGCGLGEVSASSGDACITCVAGSFSFNPENITCDACPANAGADLILSYLYAGEAAAGQLLSGLLTNAGCQLLSGSCMQWFLLQLAATCKQRLFAFQQRLASAGRTLMPVQSPDRAGETIQVGYDMRSVYQWFQHNMCQWGPDVQLNKQTLTFSSLSCRAECPGSFKVLPLAGFWSSAPLSAQVHRCVAAATWMVPGVELQTCAIKCATSSRR
jgi:hypothetical protein